MGAEFEVILVPKGIDTQAEMWANMRSAARLSKAMMKPGVLIIDLESPVDRILP